MNVFVSFCDDRLAFDGCCWFCCIDTTDGMSVATVGLALFSGCVGGLFNFELADFGTDDSFGIGVSHVGKKFDMVIRNLIMSSLAGGEPAGADDHASLVTLLTLNWLTSTQAKIIRSFGLAPESLHKIR